jgi:hypothetical protein
VRLEAPVRVHFLRGKRPNRPFRGGRFPRKKRASAVICSTIASVGTTSRTGPSSATSAAWNAIAAGERPVSDGRARVSPPREAADLSSARTANDEVCWSMAAGYRSGAVLK